MMDEIREISESAVAQSSFIYDPETGMYYDSQSGYYYDAVTMQNNLSTTADQWLSIHMLFYTSNG